MCLPLSPTLGHYRPALLLLVLYSTGDGPQGFMHGLGIGSGASGYLLKESEHPREVEPLQPSLSCCTEGELRTAVSSWLCINEP